MKKITTLLSVLTILGVILSSNLGCGNSSSANSENLANKAVNKPTEVKMPTETPIKQNLPKPDFKMSAEEYVKMFTQAELTKSDLEKYANKSVAVTGLVKMFSLEEGGTAPPYIVIAPAEIEKGIPCYLDVSNNENWRKIRKDKLLTVQGMTSETLYSGALPALSNCVITSKTE